MVDRISPARRSENMGRIKGRNTAPEINVRRILHRLGYRFRLHRKDLPGSPDLVLPKYHAVIFVHGCFWHRHGGCKFSYTPKTRTEFWSEKFAKNVERDRVAVESLLEHGWKVLVMWECESKNDTFVAEAIHNFLNGSVNERRPDKSGTSEKNR
jgi:DNA mismatch endonuclease (patch repair protein)